MPSLPSFLERWIPDQSRNHTALPCPSSASLPLRSRLWPPHHTFHVSVQTPGSVLRTQQPRGLWHAAVFVGSCGSRPCLCSGGRVWACCSRQRWAAEQGYRVKGPRDTNSRGSIRRTAGGRLVAGRSSILRVAFRGILRLFWALGPWAGGRIDGELCGLREAERDPGLARMGIPGADMCFMCPPCPPTSLDKTNDSLAQTGCESCPVFRVNGWLPVYYVCSRAACA